MKKILAVLKHPWFTRVYLLILFAWVSIYIYKQWDQYVNIFMSARIQFLLVALFFYFTVVGLINPYLHGIAYREIGSRISFWQAFRIFHLSRIGNYLPGRIWFATNFYIFSKKLDIDSEKIAKNFIVLNAILFMTGGICSLPILMLVTPAFKKLLIAFPLIMAVFIHPKIFSRLFSLVWKGSEGVAFRYIFLLKIAILYLIAYVLLGVFLSLCLMSFQIFGYEHFPLVVAAASSSVLLTLLAVFAPAGIGVAEGISAGILMQFISVEIAVSVVIAMRMVMVVVDFGCAGLSAVSVTKEERSKAQIEG